MDKKRLTEILQILEKLESEIDDMSGEEEDKLGNIEEEEHPVTYEKVERNVDLLGEIHIELVNTVDNMHSLLEGTEVFQKIARGKLVPQEDVCELSKNKFIKCIAKTVLDEPKAKYSEETVKAICDNYHQLISRKVWARDKLIAYMELDYKDKKEQIFKDFSDFLKKPGMYRCLKEMAENSRGRALVYMYLLRKQIKKCSYGRVDMLDWVYLLGCNVPAFFVLLKALDIKDIVNINQKAAPYLSEFKIDDKNTSRQE